MPGLPGGRNKDGGLVGALQTREHTCTSFRPKDTTSAARPETTTVEKMMAICSAPRDGFGMCAPASMRRRARRAGCCAAAPHSQLTRTWISSGHSRRSTISLLGSYNGNVASQQDILDVLGGGKLGRTHIRDSIRYIQHQSLCDHTGLKMAVSP